MFVDAGGGAEGGGDVFVGEDGFDGAVGYEVRVEEKGVGKVVFRKVEVVERGENGAALAFP